jgi:polar amino acid transport system substrate-binding protein
MKTIFSLSLLMLGFSLSAISAHADIPPLQTDVLAKIKAKGVLTAGVKDSLPPFGFIDEKSRQIVGYDVDFVNAIAKKLGVKVALKPVTSANRIPMLTEGNVDMLVATMTKTPERAQQVEFSHAYFMTGQKFITAKGKVKSLKDLETAKIGTAKGSTSEKNATTALPKATVLSFDDYPQAVLALVQGKVQAVTTDEAILAGLLAKMPNKDKYEIPEIKISEEPYGIAMKKGEKSLADLVNKTILEMEKNGEAAKIFDTWFGPKSQSPLKRTFAITPKN